MVERVIGNDEVSSSNLLSSSRKALTSVSAFSFFCVRWVERATLASPAYGCYNKSNLDIKEESTGDFMPHPTTPPRPMIDIHGHYLFGIDDGATDLEMSVAMVLLAQEQGVTELFCTSHDIGEQDCYDANFALLQEYLQRENIPIRIHPGCEVYCTPYNIRDIITDLKHGALHPMGSSKYVLLEFHPYVEPSDLLAMVQQVRNETGLLPIIAHAERCLFLAEEPGALNVLFRWNTPIQINAYSLVEESNPAIREFARLLLAEQRVTFLGSDAHRSSHRPPQVSSGIDYIYDTCTEPYARAICYENAARLLCP